MAADLGSVLAQTRWGTAGWAESNLKSCTFPTRCPLEAGTFCCHCMGNGGWDIWNRSRKTLPLHSLQRVHFICYGIQSKTEVVPLCFGLLNVSGCSCTYCFVKTCSFAQPHIIKSSRLYFIQRRDFGIHLFLFNFSQTCLPLYVRVVHSPVIQIMAQSCYQQSQCF